VDQEKTPRERAEDLIHLLVPDWRPTPRQGLWAIRATIVLGVLVAIGYAYGITLWDWAQLLIVPAALAGGVAWLNWAQRQRERQAEEAAREREREATAAQQERQQIAEEARRKRELERDEKRRMAENLDELRKDLLQRLRQAFNDFKRIKRLLRAQAFTPAYYGKLDPEAKVNLVQYDKHLQVLNDVQLDLEVIAADAEANLMVFEHSKQIARDIEVMADFLNDAIKESGSERGNYDPDNPPKISDLRMLAEVVGPGWMGKRRLKFKDAYKNAVKCIQRDILESNE
jgi:signal transduction histidine kinase